VEAATHFQEVLHGRLADMDLVVFLDSSQACESTWVTDELTLANNLGLTVLQLVWPGKSAFAGAALSVPVHVDKTDFINGDPGPTGRLSAGALQQILMRAEQVRVASPGFRRRRVVGAILGWTAAQSGLRAIVKPVGPIEIRTAATEVFLGWALPQVGVPTAWKDEHLP
jgi:hypothetical protein